MGSAAAVQAWMAEDTENLHRMSVLTHEAQCSGSATHCQPTPLALASRKHTTNSGLLQNTCHPLPGLLNGFSGPMYPEPAEDSWGLVYYRGWRDTESVSQIHGECIVWLSSVVPPVTSHVVPSGSGQGWNLQRRAEWG